MKMLPKLVTVLILCLITVGLTRVPLQAQPCVEPIVEVSPRSGTSGTRVSVTGQRCRVNTFVDIYYDGTRVATGRTDSSGRFTINITIPEGRSGSYEIEANLGYTRVHTSFTITPGLTATPERGPVGTNVTVKGQGFARNEGGIELRYYLDGSYKTIERNIRANAKGSWERAFQIPPSTRGEHRIDAEGAESQLWAVRDAVFAVTPGISADKSSGAVGERLTITGSQFITGERGIRIWFDSQAVVTDIRADAQGHWDRSFNVPELPAGEYDITAEGAWTRREDILPLRFEIRPGIALLSNQGHAGMNLTVAGRGFPANKDVVIAFGDNHMVTATTDGKGSFEASFPVPDSQYGGRLVTAADAAGNNAAATFAVESDPPSVPTLISPRDGGRVGLFNRVTPTFVWSPVSDASGVRYRLQIATSPNITATGEFVDPIVSVSHIVEPSHTLNATDALPYGKYYWIVQAVDGAGNTRGWTEGSSFRAVLLPVWAFIVIIVVAVILLALAIRALVRRRAIYYDRW